MNEVSATSVRRDFRITFFAEVRRDIDSLAAADAAGTLQRHGNWTLGPSLESLRSGRCSPYEVTARTSPPPPSLPQ